MIPYGKLSVYELKKIIKHFCVDITATSVSELLGYNRKTVNAHYLLFRKVIYVARMQAFKDKIG